MLDWIIATGDYGTALDTSIDTEAVPVVYLFSLLQAALLLVPKEFSVYLIDLVPEENSENPDPFPLFYRSSLLLFLLCQPYLSIISQLFVLSLSHDSHLYSSHPYYMWISIVWNNKIYIPFHSYSIPSLLRYDTT